MTEQQFTEQQLSGTIDKAEAERVALEVKEEVTKKAQDDIVTLASGHRIRYRPVPLNTVRAVQAKIVDPPVPMGPHPEDSTRMIPNPMSGEHREALRVKAEERLEATLNVLFLLGLELIDPLPSDEIWLDELILLELVKTEEAESASALQKELWYKKYVIAADTDVFARLTGLLGISEEGIAQARAAFKSNTQRAPDREPRPPEAD